MVSNKQLYYNVGTVKHQYLMFILGEKNLLLYNIDAAFVLAEASLN